MLDDDEDDFVLGGSDDGGAVPTGDSGILASSVGDWNGLRVTRNGDCATVQFRNVDVPDEVSIALYREQIYDELKSPGCKLLRFDLTGVEFLPSGMLGLLVTVKKKGYDVEVANAGENIRQSLAMSRLDTLIRVCK